MPDNIENMRMECAELKIEKGSANLKCTAWGLYQAQLGQAFGQPDTLQR